MSARLLFLILLAVGIGLIFIGVKTNKNKALIAMGILLAVIGGFGVFTALL